MRHKGALALFISLMLLPSASVLWIGASQGEPLPGAERLAETSVRTTSIIDVPEWRIGDNWNYDGYLDVADFVAGSGVSSNVQTLGGTLEVTVVDIYLIDIENASTLVYEVESIGEYESDGSIDLDGTNGCLYVDMDTTEVIRASDLATHTQEATIDVYFDPICWSLLRQTIGILTVLNTYEPPLENYDFPISVGESWEMDYEQQLEFSGSSSYVPIPDDTSDSNTTSWEVVSQGSSGVSFPGCNPSYNITNYNSDGDETGYNWYCPAIRGEIKSSYVQSFGFIAVHELASYQQAQRSTMVSIDIEYPLAPVDIDISAWVNVTNQGQPVSNQSLQFRYEAEQIVQDFTTDENGSYHLIFNTGNSPDDTVGTGELGSHGLLAWIVNGTAEDVLGASSLIIDSDVHEIDLVTRSDAVTVQRHRGNGTLTLDPHVGFNAVIGDALTFSVPVLNRGLTSSPASSLRINAPDGSVVNGDVPPLASLEEARIEVNWTVPTSQSFGYVYIDFVVDPEEEISEDGNRSNNDGVFVLYIGALPLATLLISEESLTLDEVSLDGSGSHDPDGGALECEFRIERANGQTKTVLEDDCVYEWIWNNNGEFAVTLVVSDEENDHASTTSSVIIRNRPPEITLAADEEGVQVASTITFRITNRSDADTQTPSTPVDILWGSACNEGQVGLACTVMPMAEGQYTISVLATDDDGATTQASYTIVVSNAAPHDPQAELWMGPNRLITDSRGVYIVQEGDPITLMGQAEDSSNDLDSLLHIWKPDAENQPELNHTSIGRTSIANHSYNASGMQLATLQVFDDDGEETEMLVVPIQVENVPPSISPIAPVPQVEEDEQVVIDVGVTDTPNDITSLVQCFDMHPSDDSNSDGDPRNDCDVPSNHLAHSWPDASSAPGSIVFHVTDNDGEYESVEIPIEVRNAPPTAMASVSLSNPTEGDSIVLSANGTVDSELDLKSLEFHWDIDVTDDSNGDGDPANDVDFTGRWIEFTYDSGGMKQVKLTVLDESESHSVTMDIEVEEAPFSLGESIQTNLSLLVLIILALAGIAFAVQRFLPVEGEPEDSPPTRTPVDIDEAFDLPDPEPQQRGDDTPASVPELPSERTTREIMPELDDALESLTISNPDPKPESTPRNPVSEQSSINEVLDQEDIEALFEE
ncbi:MAG: CARDB domain-containing protein [Candidatus Thalassarchaeaceae archaeon]|jgi:hypothetical protein|nr:CARDB domain-containing protein [Candidatus Thalassarchaeaceae archaeon]MDP7446218.1 CARDB domain-containing protein [Candidatus Thalassarchaeaceae archaeon]MDP7648693.1 CARDB domain-containing protein [Candidatus Thalassarchaeaceae archaeon]HJM77767.1 CARDB domain-containing protein [Candidatus Thalassarchaeaceae archaeon]HJO84930.1 CARDB domain-containing protein [Candidatus Thalassarchaeaceae archaeon]|tara:strand:- start:3284 stop:6751 length:3468 start_codon:yes stop_codon:yes gene_type:complete